MKLSVFLATIFLGVAGSAWASPMCVGGATLASYVALPSYVSPGVGGCTIGNLLFSNFSYSASGNLATAVSASNVTVTPINAGPTNSGPGIQFTSDGWNVTAGSFIDDVLLDSTFRFDVRTVDGRLLIAGASLTLLSSGLTGTGSAGIGETLQPGNHQLTVDAGGPFSSTTTFAPTGLLHATKDLEVLVPFMTTEADAGSAFIGGFQEGFSDVPEPVGAALIGSGLLALGIWRRRATRG